MLATDKIAMRTHSKRDGVFQVYKSHYTTYRNMQATVYTSPTREAQRVVYWHIFETTRSHMSALSLSHHEADKCKDNPVHPAPEPTYPLST